MPIVKHEKIGLIWDHAACHTSDVVLQHASSMGIEIDFIPAGLTSILQVCDLVLNKPLKAPFKRRYCAFKMREDPGPGGKYRIERDDILVWIEEALKEINKKMSPSKVNSSAFKKYGQDPRDLDANELFERFKALEEN